MQRIAITRAVSRAFNQCELSHVARTPIDVDLARAQHDAYKDALRALGCAVHELPEQPTLADSVFVEDTAIVLDEVAVITRPGAASRRPETVTVAAALAAWRELIHVDAPATIDGGDVLRLGRTLYVGASARSNAAAVAQLADKLARFGYRVEAAPMRDCLHLKTAVTEVADKLLLLNPAWVEPQMFPGYAWLAVDAAEPFAANALRIGDGVIYPVSQPRTADLLAREGIALQRVDMSEGEKAEGGVTCCSLVFAA